MIIDLLLVAILIKVGGALLGFAAAFLLWRFSGRGGNAGLVKKSVRTLLRVGAAIAAFIVVANLWDNSNDERDASKDEDEPVRVVNDDPINFDMEELNLSGPEFVSLGAWVVALRRTNDAERAGTLSDSVIGMLRRNEVSDDDFEDARLITHKLAESDSRAAVRAAIDEAFGYTAEPTQGEAELIGLLAAATANKDSAVITKLRSDLRTALAGEDIKNLERAVAQREERADTLEAQLEASQKRGVIGWLRGAADDLGLGFGWMAVYFTGFLALMRGQTAGKKMMGIRVVRLDAKPISWWIAFERFGGYAASLTLGLLGFMQILWDRNRQGLHDKAVETVVIEQRAIA